MATRRTPQRAPQGSPARATPRVHGTRATSAPGARGSDRARTAAAPRPAAAAHRPDGRAGARARGAGGLLRLPDAGLPRSSAPTSTSSRRRSPARAAHRRPRAGEAALAGRRLRRGAGAGAVRLRDAGRDGLPRPRPRRQAAGARRRARRPGPVARHGPGRVVGQGLGTVEAADHPKTTPTPTSSITRPRPSPPPRRPVSRPGRQHSGLAGRRRRGRRPARPAAAGVPRSAHRCPCGNPDVVATEPRLDDGTPFPTPYYLTCPRAASRSARWRRRG